MIKKTIVVSLCAVYMNTMLPMNVEIKVQSNCSGCSQNNSPADYPSYFYHGVTRVSGMFNSGFTSATNTLVTNLSEAKRFKKLGWPLNDLEAQEGLKETEATYEEVKEIIKNKKFDFEINVTLAKFDRRVTYVQEFIHTFLFNPDHAEGLERARHSLRNHTPVLSLYYRQMVMAYLEMKKDASLSTSVDLDEDLKKFKKELTEMTRFFCESDKKDIDGEDADKKKQEW